MAIGRGNLVTIQNTQIDGLPANTKIVKDKSTNRTIGFTGTFVDSDDPNFQGTWSFLSINPITLPIYFPAPVDETHDIIYNQINFAVVTFNDGSGDGDRIYSDNSPEGFTPGNLCFFLPQIGFPAFTGDQNIPISIVPGGVDIDEVAAFEQISDFNGTTLWNIGYSANIDPLNGGLGTAGYIDQNCLQTATPNGTWSRPGDGRSGTITFD